MVETDVRYKDLMTCFFLFNPLVRSVLGISLMIDVGLYVNPAFGWKDWNRRSAMNLPMWRTFVVPKQDFCVMCQLKFLCFCLPFHLFQKPTQYVCRAFLVISASKLGTILLFIYIRIIKNLSLSPRRMLISHWSLELASIGNLLSICAECNVQQPGRPYPKHTRQARQLSTNFKDVTGRRG